MIKLNAVPFDYGPRRKILSKFLLSEGNLEDLILMNATESAFLCGMLKTCRPKKILEVGVAAGGSTAIILQTLEDIGEPYEMYSVDIRKKHWLYTAEDTGFLASFAKGKIFGNLRGTHEFHLGKFLPQIIDSIGGDIDFVILDTVHFIPGEVLDFLAVLPYLKAGAIVVLHDVALNQYKRQTQWSEAYATGSLLSTVTAEKFLNFIPDDGTGNVRSAYPNIAALKINEQTNLNVDNVFLIFTLNWHYAPSNEEIKIYREFYKHHYPKELCAIFDEAIKMNLYNMVIAPYV